MGEMAANSISGSMDESGAIEGARSALDLRGFESGMSGCQLGTAGRKLEGDKG